MSRIARLRHVFVDELPEQLEDGVLYVSMPFATAAHRCCCGCGYEVVTPLSRADWVLLFDGESVSLEPSIGNWSFPCQSHYWIDRGVVVWARPWSKAQIAAGRARRASREGGGGSAHILHLWHWFSQWWHR